VLLQAERGSASEGEDHRLSACGRYALLQTLAHELCTIAVGKDQPRLLGNNLAREVGPYREIEPVALIEIILPLGVGPIVE